MFYTIKKNGISINHYFEESYELFFYVILINIYTPCPSVAYKKQPIPPKYLLQSYL